MGSFQHAGMGIVSTPAMTCAFCGKPAEGNYSIHRDAFGVGPEVDLCDAHGSEATPTCEEIWERIAIVSVAPVVPIRGEP